MAAIKLSDKFLEGVKVAASAQHRSVPKQIEYWVTIGKMAEENQDLPASFLKDILLSQKELESGDVSEYKFE